MIEPPATRSPITFARVDRAAGPDLLAVNRACPIESDFTFRFDREPDFFAWPSQVFDSSTYVAARAGERIVGYGCVGSRSGWTGGEWGPWVYFGDLRVLPEYRGERLGWNVSEALIEALPPEVTVGYFIIKKGNRVAEEIAQKFRSRSLSYRSGGILDVVNLPLFRPAMRKAGDTCRPARLSDIPDIAGLLRDAGAGRLFAPRVSEEALAALWRGSAFDRVTVAERGGRLAGVMAWRDFADVRRATVLHYSARAWPLRALWAFAHRRHKTVPALPAPGQSLNVLVTTHLAARDDDPDVLHRLIVAALHGEAGRGTHVLQVGGMSGEAVLQAVRGMLRLHFPSEVWIASRPFRDAVLAAALERPPVVDLVII